LAILGDFKEHSKQKAVHDIVSQLYEKLGSEPQKFRDYFYMLETLSENRSLKGQIRKEKDVITQVNVKNFASYQWGRDDGREEGVEEGMEKIVRHLLINQSPEQVSILTNLPLDWVMAIQRKVEH
jgi:hypothetical protein